MPKHSFLNFSFISDLLRPRCFLDISTWLPQRPLKFVLTIFSRNYLLIDLSHLLNCELLEEWVFLLFTAIAYIMLGTQIFVKYCFLVPVIQTPQQP